ncbi:hypothetical protein [Mycobacterium sp. OTB74]|nr:hypothetical protein [Mycobacterium sp. OTB74]MDH6247898.1 hypothetical protein [Mycobacterium sp. OTB74]
MLRLDLHLVEHETVEAAQLLMQDQDLALLASVPVTIRDLFPLPTG